MHYNTSEAYSFFFLLKGVVENNSALLNACCSSPLKKLSFGSLRSIFQMMDPIFLVLVLVLANPVYVLSQQESPGLSSRITVVGVVYCDTCSRKTFSRQSYFLPGAEVHVSCKFKASSHETAEDVNISVNRTTDRSGVYKLEIPHVDGVDCVDGIAIVSQCQASLVRGSNRACNIPLLKTSSNEISVKSKQDKLCIYSLGALSYKPSRINNTLCSKSDVPKQSFKDSKFFWPYLPPYWFPMPYPSLAPVPNLQPLSSLPFPPLPFTNQPSLPFHFPPLPPQFPSVPPLFHPPPPPAFSLGDPKTWVPNFPSIYPPPPPPPSLPAFDWRDPRTWLPYLPPFPPSNSPQTQKP